MNTDNNSFDPTPGLKSSPVPVLFIPFKDNEDKCNYCANKYSMTLKFEQKYCKNCLYWHIQYTKNTTNNTYLDVNISTNNSQCTEHKAIRNNFYTRNIQEWCEYCSEILYFRQVIPNNLSTNEFFFSESYVHYISKGFELYDKRSGCYQISPGWVESTLNKEPISILHLPWWDNYTQCVVCTRKLKYVNQVSESYYCQKWCSCCFTIYTGCRVSFINIDTTNIISGNYIIDEFLASTRIDSNNQRLIANYVNNDTNLNPLNVYLFIRNLFTEGGFSIIYKAIWSDGTHDLDVAVKEISNSQNISKYVKYVLNELKSLYYLYDFNNNIIGCYGISQNPLTKEYMLIMEYAKSGCLWDYLQKYFANITWQQKITTLTDISSGLQVIHRNNFVHRDIHGGNILFSNLRKYGLANGLKCWKIGDFGLSQSANSTLSNNGIYGVIPYIAPEVFKCFKFSKESDIYSLGMIMWELTTGYKPFANVEHNVNLIYEIIDGKRPEITNDTPEWYANLMKKCWDSNPLKRPDIREVCCTVTKWYQLTSEWVYSGIPFNDPVDSADSIETINQAEKMRLELIRSKKLGPESIEKSHPKTVFTSRALSSLISKSLTLDFSSRNLFNLKQEYITKEYEFDINNIQSLSTNNISSVQNSFNSQRQNAYFSKPLSKLVTIITTNSSRKRNIEELNFKTQNSRKHTKTDNSD
ncbi:kinase-like domain-containing protein [Rhizophagus irregularis DAOM 181602=DAOM 197198]|nr:kinase-like domain-containing protein [Rhizophagus irregularis DAOM 181602=DAOM 197198]